MKPWQLLAVDDDESVLEIVCEALAGRIAAGLETEVTQCSSFDEALQMIETHSFDVLLLDIRDNETAQETDIGGDDADRGLRVFEAVRERQYLPIIFYTGLPAHAPEPRPPLVNVVNKSSGIEELRLVVDSVLDSGLPTIARDLNELVADVSRVFMYDFVEPNWTALAGDEAHEDVDHLLRRRLAREIDNRSTQLAGNGEGPVHPIRLYVPLPVGNPATGELLKLTSDEVDKHDEWFIILTPSCDLVSGRANGADWVVVAQCMPAADVQEFSKWALSPSKSTQKDVDKFIVNNRKTRFFFLPGVLGVPSLIVNFERLSNIPVGDLGSYTRVTTLDSPYCENLVSRFHMHLGRVGTPDVDTSLTRDRLLKEMADLGKDS